MASRSSSVARMWLPAIQHPASRLGPPDLLSVRSTPLSVVSAGLDSPFRSQSMASLRMDNRPEHTQTEHTHWTQLPMLGVGQKVGAESRAVSQVSDSTSSISEPKLKQQVDQLEESLKERIQITGALTLKTMFKNNHPDAQPVSNRSVLLLILSKFLRRLVTSKQLKLLLQRLQLSERAVITFDELYSALRDPDPPALLTITKALAMLRGVTRTRFLERVEKLTDKDSLSHSWISASQLRNILDDLKLRLHNSDFQHFWKRLDADGIGALKLSVLLQKLGLEKKNNLESLNKTDQLLTPAKAQDINTRAPPKAEEEQQTFITIDKWLKERFRTGVQKMKAEFDKRDPDKSGKVSVEDFLQVLSSFDLQLRRDQLGLLLSHCGLKLQKTGVDYTHFLQTFQDRSQESVTHKIISNPQHRFHSEENLRPGSSVTEVEAKLTHILHSEFYSLLHTFQKIDTLNKGIVSQEEFRAAVENRFGLVISDGQFEQLLDRLPLDRLGNVQYGVFMAAFDTRKGVPSLFEAGKSAGHSEKGPDKEEEKNLERKDRSVQELSRLIRLTVAQQYRDVVREFEELDEKNSRRLTQENMYTLLNRVLVQCEVTRGEVRSLWGSLLTRQDGTVEFDQFVRHFGPSPSSCRYPNAKLRPPRRGDHDLMRLSNKLSYVSDILVDSLRAKVELSVSELWAEFGVIDACGTGFVSKEEFTEVLMSLCVYLSQYECELLANKFDLNHDGRVSYREFLRPFTSRDHVWKNGFNMAAALQSPREAEVSPKHNIDSLNSTIRKKLERKQRVVGKACVRLDTSGSGHLFAAELATVLQLCGVCERSEEIRSVFSVLTTDQSGRLDYRPLLHTHTDQQQLPQQTSQRNS